MSELVNIAGTGEGCPVCDGAGPFTSDAAAIAHMGQHNARALAWAYLQEKAIVQRILVELDEPGGITAEDEIDELIKEVELVAGESSARRAAPY
ncbi:hypothetical protein [Streptomyces spectabilis]|uniref:Uncharacterized protein n=1 Tax=Streptomyces spectabilis TaxID=68270 RepID=A0A516RA06_STRST|nr:hypothetical protein [Streptomyces spectabilis]QDQ12481.1 hypothetical protein FH965_19545 [Streptomyces spectabilis]